MPLEEVPPPPDETGNAIVDGLAIRKWEKEHGVKLKAWKLAQVSIQAGTHAAAHAAARQPQPQCQILREHLLGLRCNAC